MGWVPIRIGKSRIVAPCALILLPERLVEGEGGTVTPLPARCFIRGVKLIIEIIELILSKNARPCDSGREYKWIKLLPGHIGGGLRSERKCIVVAG